MDIIEMKGMKMSLGNFSIFVWLSQSTAKPQNVNYLYEFDS